MQYLVSGSFTAQFGGLEGNTPSGSVPRCGQKHGTSPVFSFFDSSPNFPQERKAVGFFIRLMDSIPVSRAADSACPGTGLIRLSPDDPCVVLGDGTRFLTEFTPRMQIMLSKSMNSLIAEVAEVLSDTELRIKKEFGSGKGTAKIREKVVDLQKLGQSGLDFKKLPFVDQQEMYQHVYEALNSGGSIGIFPEGPLITISSTA